MRQYYAKKFDLVSKRVIDASTEIKVKFDAMDVLVDAAMDEETELEKSRKLNMVCVFVFVFFLLFLVVFCSVSVFLIFVLFLFAFAFLFAVRYYGMHSFILRMIDWNRMRFGKLQRIVSKDI